MSKHLKTIQTLAKVGKVISTVIFILAIIGAAGCILSLVCLGILGNTEIVDIFMEESNLDFSAMLFATISGILWCVSEIILCFKAKQYFSNELEAGTPFTYKGAQEIFRLGLFAIIVPLAASVVEGIVYGAVLIFYPHIAEFDLSNTFEIGIGIALIIMSVIFKHGAELAERLQQTSYQEPQEATTEEASEETVAD